MNLEHTSLLILDMQEKLIKNINNKQELCWNINRLIKSAKILNIFSVYTEQNPSKLGMTIETIKEKIDSEPISKMSFSSAKSKQLLNLYQLNGIDNIIISGIETHICVQQSAIDFLKNGYKVYIICDAVGSRREIDTLFSFRRLENEGAILSTTESIIFEWCETSERKEFKEISNIIKEKII